MNWDTVPASRIIEGTKENERENKEDDWLKTCNLIKVIGIDKDKLAIDNARLNLKWFNFPEKNYQLLGLLRNDE